MSSAQTALSLLLACLLNQASGQEFSDYYKAKADSLRKCGIDTVVLYQPYFGPMTREHSDSLIVDDRRYLLWEKGKNLFVCQYFHYFNYYNEKSGDSVRLLVLPDTLNLFGYLREHFQEVIADTLLYSRARIVRDGKEIIRKISPENISDDVYTGVLVIVAGKSWRNGYMSGQLDDGNIRNPDGSILQHWESINYETNVKKAIHHFILRIERQVAIFGDF